MRHFEQILEFATKAHGDQKRKYTGDPYIIHPQAVAQLVKVFGGDDGMVFAALLHDVLEDTPVTSIELLTELHRIFGDDVDMVHDVHSLVVELTDVYIKENFPHLNRKARKLLEAQRLGRCSSRAQSIKYADLIDNGISITEHDPGFAAVYLREKADLLEFMRMGNSQLRKMALAETSVNA